jgi:hypothetical protein
VGQELGRELAQVRLLAVKEEVLGPAEKMAPLSPNNIRPITDEPANLVK